MQQWFDIAKASQNRVGARTGRSTVDTAAGIIAKKLPRYPKHAIILKRLIERSTSSIDPLDRLPDD